MSTPAPLTTAQQRELAAAEPYWIAEAMRVQGSRFYARLGEALLAADLENRRRLYATWPGAFWDFYVRGQVLARQG